MKKPASPKPRRPNVVKVDRVKDLAAGLRRGLSESGWSERGLALAAGLKADRVRNVGRGLSSTLPAAVLERVADVLAVPPAALTGGEPWPAGGARLKRSEPPEEPKAAASVPGSLAELAVEARTVAMAARAAVRVAIAAADAAERVAGWAEAAAAAPPESDDAIFDRWTAAAGATPATPLQAAASKPPVAPPPIEAPPAPRARLATEEEVAADPARYHRQSNIGRTPKKAWADPLTHLELCLMGSSAFQIDHTLRQIVVTRFLPGAGCAATILAEVLPDGIHLHDLELDVDLGDYSDIKEAGEAAVHWGRHRDSIASTRHQWPDACAYMRSLGAGENAETSHAHKIQWMPSSTAIRTLRELAKTMRDSLEKSGLGDGFHGRARELAEQDVSAFAGLVAAAEAAGRVDTDSLKSAADLAHEMAARVRNHHTVLMDSP